MYRPDFYEGAPLLRDILVFPMSFVWYPDIAARWGLPLAALLLVLAGLLATLAGRHIARRDVG